MLGRLVARQAFEVTKHERQSIPLRQSLEFIVENLFRFAPACFGLRINRRLGIDSRIGAFGSNGFNLRLARQSKRDAVQPTAHRLPLSNRCGFAGENQKRGLEDVFGEVFIMKDAPTNAQHHWPVTFQQRGEGEFVAPGKKPFQQASIRETFGLLVRNHGAKPSQKSVDCIAMHYSFSLQPEIYMP